MKIVQFKDVTRTYASGDVWAHVNLGRKRAEVLSKKEKTEEDFANALKGTGYKVSGFEPRAQD